MNHEQDPRTFADEVRDRQRNTLWPDVLINSRAADVFLLRGSSNPTMVQRVGAWIFGLICIGNGLVLLYLVKSPSWDASSFLLILPWGFILLGARVFLNGFRKTRQ